MLPLITKKNLLGTFNRPPNFSQDVLTSIEGSISLAYDSNIQNIHITGDFNLDVLKSSFNKKYLTCVNISVYINSLMNQHIIRNHRLLLLTYFLNLI